MVTASGGGRHPSDYRSTRRPGAPITCGMTTSRRPYRRPPAAIAASVATAVLVVAVVVTATPGPAAGSDAPAYIGRINSLRSSRGLAPLEEDGTLDALATDWARHLAAIGGLQHASDLSIGVSRSWSKLGENVGTGPDTGTIFDAFVASPSHYRNLVDPSFTHVGVGVVWSGGTQYTVHRFLASAEPSPPTSVAGPEPQVRQVVEAPPAPAPEPASPAPDEPAPEPVPAPAPAGAGPTEAPERFATVALALART